METLFLIVLVAGGFVGWRLFFKRGSVKEYEVGLLYRENRFVKQLPPGCYWLQRVRSKLITYDTREKNVVVPGQDILTADNVGLKVSLVITFSIQEPKTVHMKNQSYLDALYSVVQIALRNAFSNKRAEDLLKHRLQLGEEILEQTSSQIKELGLEVKKTEIRDIMFPGELKKVFSDVARAQTEAKANLERARGEMAALRALSNAARMIEKQPLLMSLRELQTAAAASQASGNTLVIGLSDKRVLTKMSKKEESS